MEKSNLNQRNTLEEKELKVDYEQSEKIIFSRGFKLLLGIALFFTGILTAFAFPMYLFYGIREKLWLDIGMNQMATQILFYLTIMVLFVVLVKIAISRRPFSKTLVRGIRLIGIFYIVAAIVCPHLSEFQKPGFVVLFFRDNWYLEGNFILIGLLFIIFSGLLSYGFTYQRESDETL